MGNIQAKNLAVLVSGGGTNMQAILDEIARGNINGKVRVVISSSAEAYALTRATGYGIETVVCSLKEFKSREKRDERLLEILKSYNLDYILLAGYLGIISSPIIDAYPYRIINIHPALLPLHGGKNCFGINVHKEVIAAHDAFSGATVHFVDSGTDTGLIIAQWKLPVLQSDTAESLQQKILVNIEHKLFPSVVKDLCDNKIWVENGKVIHA